MAFSLRRLLLVTGVLALLGLAEARAQRGATVDDPFAGFDQYALDVMKQWKVPGMAIAVVRGDSVLMAKGYGVRTLGDPTPVDPQTLFAIGSASKAFTGAALEMLAEEGKISFDSRVTAYLPWFEMPDPWVTREITVRDLLLHRSGLGNGDAIWFATNLSREQVVRAIRNLPPITSFRTRFGYQNLMYITAGEVVSRVSGVTWDEFIKRRIFAPLGMSHSNTSVEDLTGLPNVATPHAELGGVVKAIPYRNIDNAGPAGSINSNVVDVAKWLRLWINEGTFAGDRLLTKAMVREAIRPQFAIGDPFFIARMMSPDFLSYGFGWFVEDFRGRRWVNHGGNIDGMAAQVGFLPEDGIGVVVLTNMNQSDATIPLTANLFDRVLGISPPHDYAVEYRAAEVAYDEKQRAESKQPERVQGTKPSLPLAAYAGVYRNSYLGTATVRLDVEGTLSIQYDARAEAAELEHWHHDSFVASHRDPILGKVPVTFRLGHHGQVATMIFPLVSSVPQWVKQ